MSQESENWYAKFVANTEQRYGKIVEEANRQDKDIIFPQNILALKALASKLATDSEKHFTFWNEDKSKFGFSECLVNKLMLLAYLVGTQDMDERSFSRGWNECLEDVAKKLGLYYEC